ncbi:MAG: hypothetical protein HY892_23000 [Deltaproteobacteria bacterium]|nr:hypothetical protein [Deltaproteobacteria bacterium]
MPVAPLLLTPRLIEQLPQAPVAAFTATATPRVQGDIVLRLRLRDPLLVRASFDRPNLFFEVQPRSKRGGPSRRAEMPFLRPPERIP